MKPRTLILLMVAVGCGLVAAFLTSQLAGKGQVDKIKVPVAREVLRQGTFIREPEAMFETKEVARELVPPNTILDVTKLKNKSLQRTLDAGSMCTNRDLGDTEGLGKNLPEGHRAQTIRVTVDSAVAGFILPGSHVDLVCMVPDSKDPRQTMAKTFLQNKLVLAVNTDDVRPEGAKVMAAPAFVTLALLPEEVERVARASRDGVPVMTMRKPGDDKLVKTAGAATPFGRGSTDTDVGLDTKEVLVAKKPIPAGTKITDADEYFETKKISSDMVPPDAVTDKSRIQGATVHKFLGERLPLTAAYLVKDGGTDKTEVAVNAPPKFHKMRIYSGANYQDHQFENGVSATREPAPPPTVTPPGKDGGSEGK